MTFKLALAQMLVKGGDRSANLANAAQMIQQAAASGADIVLLPEAMDLGWTHPSALTEAEPIPDGATCRALSIAARENGVFVCSGLIEKAGADIYNSAVLIYSDGNVLLHHRKLNELEIGHDYYQQGDRLNVCHTKFGTIGLMICADAFARDGVLTRSLCYMGADIILSPSAWAVPPGHDNTKEPYGGLWERVYASVAKEFAVWIAGVSNVGEMTAGPWEGHNCIGCSQVTDPTGQRVAFGPYGVAAETILYTDIELVRRPARGCGWGSYWASQKT